MRLAPLVIPRWVTEIQSVKPMESFIDNQLHGPYRLWHHLHRFEANEQGVLMTDLVNYALPFGPLGAIAHALYVRKKLERIFQFRKKTLAAHFWWSVPRIPPALFREQLQQQTQTNTQAKSPETLKTLIKICAVFGEADNPIQKKCANIDYCSNSIFLPSKLYLILLTT